MTRFAALVSGLSAVVLLAVSWRTWLDHRAAVAGPGVLVGAALAVGVLSGLCAVALWTAKTPAPPEKKG